MKALRFLLLGSIFALSILTSCNKADNNNPLANTKWAASSGEHTFWIEFTSGKDFMEFMGDINGNPASTGVSYGTYSYSDNKVLFLTHNSSTRFDYATIKGTVMELHYKTGPAVTTYIKK